MPVSRKENREKDWIYPVIHIDCLLILQVSFYLFIPHEEAKFHSESSPPQVGITHWDKTEHRVLGGAEVIKTGANDW